MRFVLIILSFAILVLGVFYIPQTDTPAVEFKVEMPMEYGAAITEEVDLGSEYAEQEFIKTALPEIGIELYLPSEFVNQDNMFDLLADGIVRENAENTVYVSTEREDDVGYVTFYAYCPYNGILRVSCEDITSEEYESAREETIETLYPNKSSSQLRSGDYKLERVELQNTEGYINVITYKQTYNFNDHSDYAGVLKADIYTPDKFYRVTFYDAKGIMEYTDAYDADQEDNSRIDRLLYYIRQLELIEE